MHASDLELYALEPSMKCDYSLLIARIDQVISSVYPSE